MYPRAKVLSSLLPTCNESRARSAVQGPPIGDEVAVSRAVVVAVSLTLAIGAGSAGTAAAVSASGDVTVSANAGRASSGSKGSARSRGRDRSGQDVLRRLERRGLRADWRGESFSTDCAAHSYGQVQQYFQDHPSDALFRALYEVEVPVVPVYWWPWRGSTCRTRLEPLR